MSMQWISIISKAQGCWDNRSQGEQFGSRNPELWLGMVGNVAANSTLRRSTAFLYMQYFCIVPELQICWDIATSVSHSTSYVRQFWTVVCGGGKVAAKGTFLGMCWGDGGWGIRMAYCIRY